MRRLTLTLVILGAMLGGCIVPVAPVGPGRPYHYHHHDWR